MQNVTIGEGILKLNGVTVAAGHLELTSFNLNSDGKISPVFTENPRDLKKPAGEISINLFDRYSCKYKHILPGDILLGLLKVINKIRKGGNIYYIRKYYKAVKTIVGVYPIGGLEEIQKETEYE